MNLDEPIRGLDGVPAPDGGTVRSAILLALLNTLPDDTGLELKLELFRLAQKVHLGGAKPGEELELSEAVLVMERVGIFFAPLVVGRVAEQISPKSLK